MGQLVQTYVGGAISAMVAIGHKTGLFEAAAAGPATSAELAERAGLTERYVREWLGAVTTAGIFDLRPGERDVHPACRARRAAHRRHLVQPGDPGADGHLSRGFVDPVIDAFRNGGGVPYDRYRPEFTSVMDEINRRAYDEHAHRHVRPARRPACGAPRGRCACRRRRVRRRPSDQPPGAGLPQLVVRRLRHRRRRPRRRHRRGQGVRADEHRVRAARRGQDRRRRRLRRAVRLRRHPRPGASGHGAGEHPARAARTTACS